MNCARKSEMVLWKSYFEVANDPKELYKTSLEQGDLATATSYLIIIQTLESAKVSSDLATHLFDRALNLDEYQAASELYRFLRTIDGLF